MSFWKLPGSLGHRAAAAGIVAVVLTGSTATVMAITAPTDVANQVGPSSSEALVFVSVAPTRILDTRGAAYGGPIGAQTAAPVGAGQTMNLVVSGQGHAVPSVATAVVMNATLDRDATARSFVTIWAAGDTRPATSTINVTPGEEIANQVTSEIGTASSISVFNFQGNVNVILDLVGYFVPLNQVTDWDNNTLLNGSGTPADEAGNDGDYYIDNDTDTIYGPKADGMWPTGTSLVGPVGPQGDMGATGSDGPQGTMGDTGSDGPQGTMGDTGSAGPQGDMGTTGSDGPMGATGSDGPQGSMGPKGDDGTANIASGFSAYNNGGSADVVNEGVALSFPSVQVMFGTDISPTSDTFTVNTDGVYEVTYHIENFSDAPTVASYLTLNGGFVGSTYDVSQQIGETTETQLFSLTAGDNIQVMMGLANGTVSYRATIVIQKVSGSGLNPV